MFKSVRFWNSKSGKYHKNNKYILLLSYKMVITEPSSISKLLCKETLPLWIHKFSSTKTYIFCLYFFYFLDNHKRIPLIIRIYKFVEYIHTRLKHLNLKDRDFCYSTNRDMYHLNKPKPINIEKMVQILSEIRIRILVNFMSWNLHYYPIT